MPLFIKAIDPELQILGPAQQFKFDQNLSSVQLDSSFVPTSLVASQNNFETRNNTLSGFRWVHLTNLGDTFGQLKLQSFVNASPTGTDIMLFNQDGSITFDSTVIIHIPPIVEVDGILQTFRYDDAHNAGFTLQNTFAATGGNPSFVDLKLENSTTGGFRFRHTSSTTDITGLGALELDFISSSLAVTQAYSLGMISSTPSHTFYGNVGIGGVTPHGPLQFPNSYGRKVIVWEDGNNNYQFFGLSIMPNELSYYVNTGSDHVWYIGTSPTTSTQLMRLNGNGNLGIGNIIPNSPLQFLNILGRKIVLWQNGINDHQYYGLGINNNIMRYQVPDSTITDHVWYAGTSSSTSNELMRLKGTGNLVLYDVGPTSTALTLNSSQLLSSSIVFTNTNLSSTFYGMSFTAGGLSLADIGYSNLNSQLYIASYGSSCQVGTVGSNLLFSTSTAQFSTLVGLEGTLPHSPLQFSNNLGRKLTLYETANNAHQYFGFGIDSSVMRYQIGATTNDNVWYAATSSSTSNELMRLKGVGDLYLSGTFYGQASYGSMTVTSSSLTNLGTNNPASLNVTTISGINNQFSMPNNNRLQYNGSISRNFLITVTVSAAFTLMSEVSILIYNVATNVSVPMYQTIVVTGNKYLFTNSAIASLNPGDYIQVVAISSIGLNGMTTYNMSVTANAV